MFRCVHCRYCGTDNPGFGCEWLKNYTECGPCHSVTDCPVCEQCYMDNELVIQCTQCERLVLLISKFVLLHKSSVGALIAFHSKLLEYI